MKESFTISTILLMLFVGFSLGFAQQDVTIKASTSEAAEGLDLNAVGELFKDSENLQEFEKALNDPTIGINNLDLDKNGEVDFIRLVEQVADDTHIIILQIPLARNEYQDVATIEIEKSSTDMYNMQVRGNEVIYGASYYLTPVHVRIHPWPIMRWIYRPLYHPYQSVYHFGKYPPGWKAYRPVKTKVYLTRTVRFTKRKTFVVIKNSRVKSIHKVNYKSKSSRIVKKPKVVLTKNGKKTTVKVRAVNKKKR